MIIQAYVMDIAVRELASVEPVFTKLLGGPPVPMHPDMDPSGGQFGTHYTVEGLYAIGLMGLRNPEQRFPPPSRVTQQYAAWMMQQRLAKQGEGPFLLGFLVDDIDKQITDLRKRGVRFLTKEPLRYMVGRNIVVDANTTFGMTVYYGQHDQDAYERWIATDPSRAPKEVKPAPRKPYVVAAAVQDLDAATPVFEDLLGKKGVPMQPELDPSGQYLEGVHFAVGGLQSFALVALRDATRRYPPPSIDPSQISAWLVQRHLDTKGEGLFFLGLRADNLDAEIASVSRQGIQFMLHEPWQYKVGRLNVVDPHITPGVTVAFSQHDPAAYQAWRDKG
jgi:catechol 2,3-dioxygenase-like lactoylglutathione lyase family enzyme